MSKRWPYQTFGIRDNLFIRGKVPMTKSEVRAISMSKLKLQEGLKVLDIGAGTGSISVECGLAACHVTAIEHKDEGVELIKQNIEAFEVETIEIIKGKAPNDLYKNKVYDRVFIGGSGGQIEGIFKYLHTNLISGGRLVANTITIENTNKLLSLLKHYKYEQIEVVQINVSRSKPVAQYHMMIAENPISIISAEKNKKKEGKENG